jgi:hypothetical protein
MVWSAIENCMDGTSGVPDSSVTALEVTHYFFLSDDVFLQVMEVMVVSKSG